jgi:Trypsin-like peptidase domain
MTALTGKQVQNLSSKLSTTLSLGDLQSVVYASTGDRLYVEYVGEGKPLRPTIEELLQALEQAGTTERFLRDVYNMRQRDRPDVAAAITAACPEVTAKPPEIDSDIQVQEAGKPQQDGPTKAAAPGFERNIKPRLRNLDIHAWITKMASIERQVCRVESNGNAAGTGFLVGPNAVLTNWHVVQDALHGNQIGGITCRFDYYRSSDNARNPGIPVAVANDGCLSHRTYSQAETTSTPDTPEPTGDELDFALLKLAEPIGHADAGGHSRGWIILPRNEVPLEKGAPLLIVQHPDGAPMKFALDTDAVIGLNAGHTRLRYSTNTEAGSSGSPCFDMDFLLAALHHYGDPAWQSPKFNQGIPAHLIRQKIESDGLAELLGAGAT